MSKLRVLVPVAIVALAGVGFALGTGTGTLSAFGWGDVSLLCPLGALGTMLASKTVVPRAVISLVIAIVAIVVLGRAFCGWICPVPVVSKLRGTFSRRGKKQLARSEAGAEGADDGASSGDAGAGDGLACAGAVASDVAAGASAGARSEAPLTEKEQHMLKGCGGACASCADARASVDSRHFVLGGALLSAAVFGFPVFCLICPIGLTFATVFLVIMLFGSGSVSWSVVVVPLLLLVEVVFFRKWCSKLCPLSALMSLVGKLNRTFRPVVDDAKCLESSKGVECGRCASMCEVAIDPRHPDLGARWSECTKCRACVEACPAQAISMPFLPKRQAGPSLEQLSMQAEEAALAEKGTQAEEGAALARKAAWAEEEVA